MATLGEISEMCQGPGFDSLILMLALTSALDTELARKVAQESARRNEALDAELSYSAFNPHPNQGWGFASVRWELNPSTWLRHW